MTVRTTITLDDKNVAFIDAMAAGNRSAYINMLVKQEKKRRLAEALLKANLEEAADEELQAELKLWDVTLADGLDDED